MEASLDAGHVADVGRLAEVFNRDSAAALLCIRCEAIGHGWARCILHPPSRGLNPNGAVNGGLLAALADQAGSLAATAGRGHRAEYLATVSLNVQFVRPCRQLPVVAEAALISRGRRIVSVNVEARDADGALCVVASGAWHVSVNASYGVP